MAEGNGVSLHTFWYRRAGAALVICLLVASNGFGWGPKGHQVVATIAESHLTAKGSREVQAILGRGESLATVSTWADDVRLARPETAPWHYIDIPLNAAAIDRTRDCPNGDCVTAAITRSLAVLRDASSSADAKNEALKFIDHFVGDLHQPLHCEDNSDKGGNGLHVRFFGEEANLHSVWDVFLIERINPDAADYAAKLNAAITKPDIAAWDKGTVEDWALESHRVAQQVAYGRLPQGQEPDLATDYLRSASPAVNLQLQKAGIRLAYLLNQALQ